MALKGKTMVLRNLDRRIKGTIVKSKRAMAMAVTIVKRASAKMTPVETGNLKASHATEVRKTSTKIIGEISVGRGAAYAVYVHEAPMKLAGQKRPGKRRGYYWDPQGQATNKFLEKALFRSQDKVLQTLTRVSRMK